MYKQFLYKLSIEDNGIMDILLSGASICDETYKVERASSPFYIFGYIFKGCGTLQVNNNTYYPKEGDIYILPKHSKHFYYCDKENPWRQIFFHADGKLVDSLMQSYQLNNVYLIQGLDVSKYFLEIISIIRLNKIEKNHEINIIFHKILLAIHCHLDKQELKHSALAIEIKNYLDNTLEKKFSLDEIAKKAFKSKTQIINVFKKEFGITPYEYIIHNRIELAKILLGNQSHLSIKETAYKLSFSDEHYFSNFFKKRTGLSPLDYKKISSNTSTYLKLVASKLLSKEKNVLLDLIRKGLMVGISSATILQYGLVQGVCNLYESYSTHTYCAQDVEQIVEIYYDALQFLSPNFSTPSKKVHVNVVIGSIFGEFHDFGKNIVKVILEGKGFIMHDLGNNVTASTFIDKAVEFNAKAIVCSASCSQSLIQLKKLIKEFQKSGLRYHCVIMIGGSCINQSNYRSLHADIYTPDAFEAAYSLFEALNKYSLIT